MLSYEYGSLAGNAPAASFGEGAEFAYPPPFMILSFDGLELLTC